MLHSTSAIKRMAKARFTPLSWISSATSATGRRTSSGIQWRIPWQCSRPRHSEGLEQLRVVIDANVLIAANRRDTHVTAQCAAACGRALLATTRNAEHRVLEDAAHAIFAEYKRYCEFSGQPGPETGSSNGSFRPGAPGWSRSM